MPANSSREHADLPLEQAYHAPTGEGPHRQQGGANSDEGSEHCMERRAAAGVQGWHARSARALAGSTGQRPEKGWLVAPRDSLMKYHIAGRPTALKAWPKACMALIWSAGSMSTSISAMQK